MFISLYPGTLLKKLKRNLLIVGSFLAAGGIVTLLRELQLPEPYRVEWLFAANFLVIAGAVTISMGLGFIPFKEAYFSMNPSRLSFRLTFLGREQVLYWNHITSIRVSDARIEFNLNNNTQVKLYLSTIPDDQVARHIKASVSLAALERNVEVNGVLAQPQEAVA